MAFLEEYTLLDELGQGGYATVYKVRHNKLGYIRAIRVLNAIIAHGEEDKTYQKFLEECRLLLRLGNGNHPNIVHIYQPLLKEQRAIVEMDFVDGKDLYHYLESNHSFVEIKDVMRLLTDIGSALAYCHEDIYKFCMDKDEDNLQDDPEDGSKVLLDEETKERLIEKYRVIHNDIHSCNIIRREDGTYVLLDFGLAIEGGSVVRSSRRKNGAPEFKSPEKWDNESILTTQSDIYSFGVVLYEYLAGRVPFVFDKSKSNPAEAEYLLGEAHKKQEPTPIYELRKTAFENAHPGETYKKDYPDWLEALIMKCLSKSINERFKNGKELYDYVLAHIGNEYDAQIESLTQEIKAKEVVIKELANSLAKAQIETQEIKAELEKIKKENRILSDKLQEANQATDNIGDPIPAPNTVEGTPQEWVDLGLPSGTKWATCNVGASSQEDFGNYYAWGETTPKSEYTESNSVTIKNNPDDLCNSGIIDTEGNLTMQNDAARQNWGGDWRMPTYEEFEELKITCTWRWTTKNGIDGYEVIGSNGNSIFLPLAGMCVESSCYDVGVNGTYWTSNVVTDNDYAFGLGFDSDGCTMYTVLREYGLPVRPVIGSSTPSEPDNDGRDEKGGVKWQVVLIIITILILLCLGLFVKNSNNINTPPLEACNDTIAACDTIAVIEPVVEVEVNGVKFNMIYVEGGTFTMGATSEQGSDYESNERPTHKVTLSDYYIGETEVTQELWKAVMGNNPSYHTGNPHYPVEKVSWEDCQEFIQELNRLTGKRFRLPTEAEWEFAARGGNQSKVYIYSGSNRIDDVAWYGVNSGSMTHEVATCAPNELGIYDMSGNVWEECSDWYGNYSSSSQTDPSGPTSGYYRVARGGCCINPATSCRVSCRAVSYPDVSSYISGFRLACDHP